MWSGFYPSNRFSFPTGVLHGDFDKEVESKSVWGDFGGVCWGEQGESPSFKLQVGQPWEGLALQTFDRNCTKILGWNRRWMPQAHDVRLSAHVRGQTQFFRREYPLSYVPHDILDKLVQGSYEDNVTEQTATVPLLKGNRLACDDEYIFSAGGPAWSHIYVRQLRSRAVAKFLLKLPALQLTLYSTPNGRRQLLVRHRRHISILSLTTCGEDLTLEVDRVYACEHDICDADWSPLGQRQLAFVCTNGNVGLVDEHSVLLQVSKSTSHSTVQARHWVQCAPWPETFYLGKRDALTLFDCRDQLNRRESALVPYEAEHQSSTRFTCWRRHCDNPFLIAGATEAEGMGIWDVRFTKSPALFWGSNSGNCERVEAFTEIHWSRISEEDVAVVKWSRRFPRIEAHFAHSKEGGALQSNAPPLRLDPFTTYTAGHVPAAFDVLRNPDPGCYLPSPTSYHRLANDYYRHHYVPSATLELEGLEIASNSLGVVSVFQLDSGGGVYAQRMLTAETSDCALPPHLPFDADNLGIRSQLALVSTADHIDGPEILKRQPHRDRLSLELKSVSYYDFSRLARWLLPPPSVGQAGSESLLGSSRLYFPLIYYFVPHSIYEFNHFSFSEQLSPALWNSQGHFLERVDNFTCHSEEALQRRTLESIALCTSQGKDGDVYLEPSSYSLASFYGKDKTIASEQKSDGTREALKLIRALDRSGTFCDSYAEELLQRLFRSTASVVSFRKTPNVERASSVGYKNNCFTSRINTGDWTELDDSYGTLVSQITRFPVTQEKVSPKDLQTNNVFPVSKCAMQLVERLKTGYYDNLDERILSEKPPDIPIKGFDMELVSESLDEQQVYSDNAYLESLFSSFGGGCTAGGQIQSQPHQTGDPPTLSLENVTVTYSQPTVTKETDFSDFMFNNSGTESLGSALVQESSFVSKAASLSKRRKAKRTKGF